MKILICDDEQERGEALRRRIEDVLPKVLGTRRDYSVLSWNPADLKDAVESLVARGRALLDADASSAERGPFDDLDVDIVFLDNNLAKLRIPGARHTAEALVGHIRAFTDSPYVVSLNKNPEVDFDLRYLAGDHRTLSDVAIRDVHLSIPQLWSRSDRLGVADFLPWYWPTLEEAVRRRRQKIDFVKRHLHEPVFGVLAFPEDALDFMSPRARCTLSPDEPNLASVTFTNFFVTSCVSLPIRKDREKLAEAAGERGDAATIVARVVAAEFDRWLRQDVLGPQDVLVDVPHLLMRLPFLLGKRSGDLDEWNAAVSAVAPPFGLSAEIYREHLAETELAQWSLWTGRPCFWWPRLKRNQELNDMFYRDRSPSAAAVFCEDLSRFALKGTSADGAEGEFVAGFGGPWARRQVAVVDGQSYSPRNRFAL